MIHIMSAPNTDLADKEKILHAMSKIGPSSLSRISKEACMGRSRLARLLGELTDAKDAVRTCGKYRVTKAWLVINELKFCPLSPGMLEDKLRPKLSSPALHLIDTEIQYMIDTGVIWFNCNNEYELINAKPNQQG